ncbi:MAG: S1-like domain-containing RNA-binding protein [Bacteroidales bacterium]|nr:S1-like domain-containing RNA-binding protein [Clostridium sp.]MCM1204188.1 S1-like domain-containing RNA-binding protein [Bacteroidales bacterium]
MIEIGKWQTLQVVREKEFGVYLAEEKGAKDAVLLPIRQVPAGLKTGGSIEVFVYLDSADRPIATVNKPLITLGEIAKLKVASVGGIGAFMDWGLEKDILLPFKEMVGAVREGREYLVCMYMDKSSRPCVTMRLYDYLSTDSPYQGGEQVEGYIYRFSETLGAFVAVDNRYQGLIPRQELHKKVHVGDTLSLRITSVREDGKLNLAVGKPAYQQMEEDSEMVYQVILSYDGALPFTDKASPAVIERELGLSKNAFKRAVGRLLKEGRIEIREHAIVAVDRQTKERQQGIPSAKNE